MGKHKTLSRKHTRKQHPSKHTRKQHTRKQRPSRKHTRKHPRGGGEESNYFSWIFQKKKSKSNLAIRDDLKFSDMKLIIEFLANLESSELVVLLDNPKKIKKCIRTIASANNSSPDSDDINSSLNKSLTTGPVSGPVSGPLPQDQSQDQSPAPVV